MGKIFKQLARHWAACLAVVALLFVQAYCDLSLPDYTSKIVDTGIQQGGIESSLPETVRQSTLDALSLLMGEEDADALQNAYGYYLQDNGVLKLRSDLTDAERTALEEAVTTPDIVLYMAAAQNANAPAGDEAEAMTAAPTAEDLDAVCAQFAAMAQMPGFSREMIQQQLASAMEQVDETTLSSMASQATLLISLEYEAQGVSHDVQMAYLFRVGGQMLALTLLMVVVAILVGLIASRVSASIGRELRRETFSSVIHFSNAEIENFSTASLITRTTNDIQQVQMVTAIFLRMLLYAPILGVGGILKVVHTGAGMGWVIVLAVLVILGIVGVLMSIAMPKFKLMQVLVDKVNLVSREILTGLSVIRAFGREKTEEERFDQANRNLTRTNLFVNRVMTFMMPVMMLIMYSLTILIVWVGAHRVDGGSMQVGSMTAFITYAMMIVMSFLMLTMMSVMLPRASVAAGRIDEVLQTETSVKESETPKHLDTCKGVLAFDHVHFRYPHAEEDALSDLCFTAEPGKTTAIIGSTGCGKSTLVNLIPRLYDATEGSITLDGVELRDLPLEELRQQIGFVPQKGVLFSGTIASNLRFGNPDASDAEIEQAAEIAQAMEFIGEKPDRFDSDISQGGTNVSGGQKQRLTIARAIAKHPKVFVFDDSFSALDLKTDAALRKALGEQVQDSTMIIVAQRISTILHADQILVLEEGKIVGKGTHEELLRSCEVYQQIAKSQLSAAELGLEEDTQKGAVTDGE